MIHAIGIDVGGTTIKSALVSQSNEIVYTHTTPTPREETELLDTLEEHVRVMESHAQELGLQFLDAVGIATPGIVDVDKGTVVFSANLGWQNFAIREAARKRLNRPVVLGHDVSSGALAEFAVGPSQTCVVYLALGTGFSVVTSLNGSIVRNAGWAGEIGQALVLDPVSGQRIRLERIVSASAIAHRYNELSQAAGNETRVTGSHEVFIAAEAKDPIAEQVIRSAVEYLAEALAQVCCLLGPVHFIVGGGLSKAGATFIDPLADEIARFLEVVPGPTFSLAKFGSTSQTIGAAMLAFNATPAEVAA